MSVLCWDSGTEMPFLWRWSLCIVYSFKPTGVGCVVAFRLCEGSFAGFVWNGWFVHGIF